MRRYDNAAEVPQVSIHRQFFTRHLSEGYNEGMADGIDDKTHSVALPYEWAIKGVLGPTVDELGIDIAKLYEKGRDRLLEFTVKKAGGEAVKSDGKRANLRIARDVFWNGVFNDEAICAEYFSGVLAQSRTTDGRDDKGIFFLDIIKSLSSTQLLLHYLVMSGLNKKLVDMESEMNLADVHELRSKKLYVETDEIYRMGIDLEVDLAALYAKGLLNEYQYNNQKVGDKAVHVTWVSTTTLGIQLFAVASNRLNEWRSFDSVIFDNFSITDSFDRVGLSVESIA